MLSHLEKILAEFVDLEKTALSHLAAYILSLMLVSKRHELQQVAKIKACHESQVSRFLNRADAPVIAKKALNRAARRRLAVLPKLIKQGKRLYCIVDATLTGRRSKNVENVADYNNGKGHVRGHKFINFILLIENVLIPVCVLAHYSRAYCDSRGLDYKTEAQLVESWMNSLPSSRLIPKDHLKDLHFIFDSGYDVKALQRAIRRIGAHFTMSIKSNRIVGGLQAKEFFRRHRNLPWKTIRLSAGSGGKGSRRSYRTRHQARVNLKGYGPLTLVCSEMKRKSGKMSRKYLVSSDPGLSVRRIVDIYRRRWVIETWHKRMKQEHGYRDCKSPKFSAVEAHVNLCLAAYVIAGDKVAELPAQGTTLTEYLTATETAKMATMINQYGGRKRIQAKAYEAMQAIKAA